MYPCPYIFDCPTTVFQSFLMMMMMMMMIRSRTVRVTYYIRHFFQIKSTDIFLISPQKHMLWYSLEVPQRGTSNAYPQPMFSWRNYKKLLCGHPFYLELCVYGFTVNTDDNIDINTSSSAQYSATALPVLSYKCTDQ